MKRRMAELAERIRVPARLLRVLVALALLLPTLALIGGSADAASIAVLALVVVAAGVVAALTAAVVVDATCGNGPSPEERCRHGRFRRQTNPHTPGRPRPRAPVLGLLPV